MKRKILSLLLASAMLMTTLVGCVETASSTNEDGVEIKKIAMVTDSVGTNPFLTQIVDKLEEMTNSGEFPMSYSIIECTDANAWKENIRSSVEENFDLILGVGYMAADPMKEISEMFPDRAEYVVIDTDCDSPYVKSYSFRPEEGAYLIGAVAALMAEAVGQAEGPFGGVHVSPGSGSFPIRYGYMQGARRVNDDLEISDFIFNFTQSFTDAPLAKELALQQAAQGCVFINGASALADYGTFEAALEKEFFTSGQDSDQTNPDNEYIVTTQVKYTGQVAEIAVREFFETGVIPGHVSLGIAEGAVGATYITDDGINERHPLFTDEMVEQVRSYMQEIIDGDLDLTVPDEADYK